MIEMERNKMQLQCHSIANVCFACMHDSKNVLSVAYAVEHYSMHQLLPLIMHAKPMLSQNATSDKGCEKARLITDVPVISRSKPSTWEPFPVG